jgi:predicted hydrolase (HD superfamily)
MITRQDAFDLVTTWIENKNLVKHMLAVEAAMGSLAKHFGEDEEYWKIIGLIHDADYEKYPDKHPLYLIDYLEKLFENKKGFKEQGLIDAIRAHAYNYNGLTTEPKSKLEWSLYCCDELTGLIIAVTLVRPEKRLELVTVENVLSKWEKKDFAKGVSRSQIALCEEKLGIKLPDFIEIVLKSMQCIANDLEL